MITIKSQSEIDLMRKAGKVVAECHELLESKIEPGITTQEQNRNAEE